jgi:Fic family protein
VIKSIFEGLKEEQTKELLMELKIHWTYDSTGIEGNTMSLGDTREIITGGVTISGKAVSEHREVEGHARAVDMILEWSNSLAPLTAQDLFDLHKAVQTEIVCDTQSPVGAWKVGANGTYAKTPEGRVEYREYADPRDVPEMMETWLSELNGAGTVETPEAARDRFCRLHTGFTRIHPFYDGNGRCSRLLSNLPVLRSGFPPLLIAKESRAEYIDLMNQIDTSMGTATLAENNVFPQGEDRAFVDFCQRCWQPSLDIVARIRACADELPPLDLNVVDAKPNSPSKGIRS